MDVNRAAGITPVGKDPQRSPQEREGSDKHPGGEQPNHYESGSWRGEDAVNVDGLLAADVSPEIAQALQELSARIEPLRAEIERAKGREAHFRDLAERHPVLPVPNRREFVRELNHVLAHLEHLSLPPAVLIVHIANADHVRATAGRKVLDAFLSNVCSVLREAVHPTDIVGSLCGSDFGIMLLSGGEPSADRSITEVAARLEGMEFNHGRHQFFPEPAIGRALLRDGITAEEALDAADEDLLHRR